MTVDPLDASATADPPEVAHVDAEAEAYEAAKTRYVRSETSLVEEQLRTAFAKRRDEIATEIESLRDVFGLRQEAATVAARRYAALYPHHVQRAEIRPPSWWERIVTFNRVDRLYRNAKQSAVEVDELKAMIRKRHDRLDALERETRRAIYLREEAVRKGIQTPEGLAAMQRDPIVRAAHARMEAAVTERARYDHQVSHGFVAPEDARDRLMGERGIAFASAPLDGAVIGGILRFGSLAYYLLRDATDRESLLGCDPAIEPLRDFVFDVVRIDGGFAASVRTTSDGVPMRVLDQLKASSSGDDVADRYASHRAALRNDRVTAKTPLVDQVEGQLIDAIARLAASVAPAATA